MSKGFSLIPTYHINSIVTIFQLLFRVLLFHDIYQNIPSVLFKFNIPCFLINRCDFPAVAQVTPKTRSPKRAQFILNV